MRFIGLTLIHILFAINFLNAQDAFHYSIDISPVSVDSLPGIHSFAFAQWQDKILIIGGRRDGLHERQPFNAFPGAFNNSDILVIDIDSNKMWSKSLQDLPVGIQEQFQSTNMNFTQVQDTLYLIGGYAYSQSQDDHITFPILSTIQVSAIIQDIIAGNNMEGNIKQIEDKKFAVTGGQLGFLDSVFYLVGGQKFDGRYNPMGHPSYVQAYTNQIRKFKIENNSSEIQIEAYTEITDPIHLRRRDFNLLAQIFPDGSPGFTISSGVFQIDEDLPYLYPVDINSSGYEANTTFNQLLSNYHSAKLSLFDAEENQMHSIFFGGMSQRYYEDDILIEDAQVPFVKTISRITRYADGSMAEYRLNSEMPLFQGSNAEFIINEDLPVLESEIIDLNMLDQDTVLLGHIVGGIFSTSKNPFNFNLSSSNTMADNSIYAVYLYPSTGTSISDLDNHNPYEFKLYPNPTRDIASLHYTLVQPVDIQYLLTNFQGQILEQGTILDQQIGENELNIDISNYATDLIHITLIFEHKYFVSKALKLE